MLKKVLQNSGSWAIAVGLVAMLPMASATAALFDQEDVDPERFVAIAVPLPQGERYNLIVLEQKSDTQLCWEETNDEGVIDPLLLTFDFSGICGRSTDSNGYSIRQVGEDLALKYRLSLRQKDGVLVLMGIPLQASYGKLLEIGRTQTVSDEFLKITLNPDWRLTRRVYQGQPLGHLYFTRDVIPPEPEETTEEIAEDPVPSEVETSLANEEQTADRPNQMGSQDASSQLSSGDESQEDASISSASGPPPLLGPVQIPVPMPQSLNEQMNTEMPVSDIPPSPLSPIPVPTVAPLGRVGAAEPDVFSNGDLSQLPQVNAAGDPPPPPFNVALSMKRYRVYVDPSNAAQSEIVKTLAPDAFWTSYKGRRVLQVGAFLKESKADSMMQALGRQGINGIIDASPY